MQSENVPAPPTILYITGVLGDPNGTQVPIRNCGTTKSLFWKDFMDAGLKNHTLTIPQRSSNDSLSVTIFHLEKQNLI